MEAHTDLAIESITDQENCPDIIKQEEFSGEIKITRIEIRSDEMSEKLRKPKGHYVTLELGEFMRNGEEIEAKEVIKNELLRLLPDFNSLLVVGVGNVSITPDSLGPLTANRILATRHLEKGLTEQLGFSGIKSVSVIAPGVLGQTGIEVMELVRSAAKSVNADAVLLIDALVAKELSRLGSTVQMSDTGLIPGSGVGNHRSPLTEQSLGVKVYSVGVPTVANAATLVYELTGEKINNKTSMIITPREIDTVIKRSCDLLSYGINCAAQPKIDSQTVMALV